MEQLHVLAGITTLDDPGFSAQEYATRYGVTVSGAKARLLKLAAQGRLVRGVRLEGGKRVTVYRFEEKV